MKFYLCDGRILFLLFAGVLSSIAHSWYLRSRGACPDAIML